MAGHSKFKNIQHRKGAQDRKRASIFSKLAREITVAAKGGAPDPDMNARLRTAIVAARAQNMPNDRIKRAIEQGAPGGDSADYEEMRYEGYGPGGIAVIVEALTDNRNRTASEVRAAFNKHNGALGETGSVSFMFDRVGSVPFGGEVDFDTLFEAAVEAGADDVETGSDGHEVITTIEAFIDVKEALEAKFGASADAALIWKPQTQTEPSEDQASTLLKLIDVLEDNDDVQKVHCNADIADEVLERLSA